MSKETFSDDTMDLLKALYHVSIAKQYFEMIGVGYKYGAKFLMDNYAKKMDFVIKDIYDRLNSESREEYRKSMIKGDTVFASELSEKLLLLNEEDKGHIETIVSALIKGHKVDIKIVEKKILNNEITKEKPEILANHK